MSDDIDWSKAPEGTTHYFASGGIPWRKVNANGDCFAYDFGRREWYSISGGAQDFYVARPPFSEGALCAEEFDHLVEPDWSKAPEGATHYNKHCSYPWLRDGDIVAYFADKRGWRDYGAPAGGRRAINEAVLRPTPQPDWSEAPEGTTHTAQDSAGRWRWFKINPASRDTLHICTGEPMEGFPANLTLKPRPSPQPETLGSEPTHPDNLAVHGFANAMGARLAQCRAAGRSGWDDPEQCPPQRLAEGLMRAVRAGKLVDVGNYAMMLWKRAQMAQQEHRVRDWLDEARRSDAAQHLGEPIEWDGTGLPPVGMLVQAQFKGVGWTEVMVVAHHLGCAVVWTHSAYCAMQPDWLRPILTPEQRAAKERDEAVAAMLADADVDPFESAREESMAQALYAAGWRKTEDE